MVRPRLLQPRLAALDPIMVILQVITVGAMAGFGAASFFRERGRVRSLRARLRGRRSQIGELREGDVIRLRGRVRALDGPGEAPLSARPCLAWELVLHRKPAKERRFSGGVDFVLEDASGSIVIRGSDAEFLLRDDLETGCAMDVSWENGATYGPHVRWICRRGDTPPPAVDDYLQRLRVLAEDPTIDVPQGRPPCSHPRTLGRVEVGGHLGGG